ncbi:MAG: histidinol-phosphate transaminase [Wenzhouxiangellaceae bacterium]|nr:histidinol-phosphate transaminase [Wenzhouxiangellaceae bacterium]
MSESLEGRGQAPMEILDYTELANVGVRNLQPYTPGKPIEELEREFGIRDSIKLASNENPFGASPKALAAARAALDDVALYPDASGFALKAALAEHHGLSPDCITLGNGSNDVLVFLAQVFLGPGLASVFSQYCFAVYPIATRMVDADAVEVLALAADHPVMPLGHDLRALFAAITPATRMVWIANPNNPTGTWLDGERLVEFLGSLPGHVICVVDEAYTEYVGDEPLGDASRWLERFPNLVVTRTFSKAYGLAGLRVGYALSNPGIADLLNRVRPAFNVNAPALAAATAALSDQAFIEHSAALNARGREQLRAGLKALGCRVIPSAGNFVLARFDRPGLALDRPLLERGVIVRPVANYGLDDYLRITVGSEAQNARLLAALAEVLEREPGA